MGIAQSHALGEGLVLHDFSVKDCNGKLVDLRTYKGKVLLVVNVASNCGFTNVNYTQMSELYAKYKDKGFEILAFPCNQFFKQEPRDSQDVQKFVCEKFKADFPVFQKVYVNGPKTAPIYKFLKASKPCLFGNRIKWNFTKFLIDKDGQVLHRYSTTTTPFAIEKDIQLALQD